MIYRIYLRSHAPGEQGRIDAKTNTHNPEVAEKAYRALLSREDLLGHPWAAVLSSDNHSIYFSRFDRELGDGRIHPDAPLDLFRDDDGTHEATRWRPAEIDWAAPFHLCARQWRDAKGYTDEQATQALRISSVNTWKSWIKSNAETRTNCSQPDAFKMLMKMLG